MPQPKSDAALGDYKALLNRAVQAETGVIVRFAEQGMAISCRFRLYTVRSRARDRNEKLYEPGDPLFGISMWDELSFLIKGPEDDGRWALHITKEALAGLEIEEI